MFAVGGTLRDRCSGPRRAGGVGEHWTTCHSECESPTLKEMPFSSKKDAIVLASFFYENGIVLASFFYENGISFDVADSSSFAHMIEESMRFAN